MQCINRADVLIHTNIAMHTFTVPHQCSPYQAVTGKICRLWHRLLPVSRNNN